YSAEFLQRPADSDAFAIFEFEFTDGFFVVAAAFFYYGKGLFDFTGGFEETQRDHGIGKVTQVHRSTDRVHQSMLSQNEDREDALLIQVRTKLMQLVVEILFAGHGVQITV